MTLIKGLWEKRKMSPERDLILVLKNILVSVVKHLERYHIDTKEYKCIEDPNKCLYCKSNNINKEFASVDSEGIKFYVICNDCFKEWHDIFSLTKILVDLEEKK